MSNIPLHLYTHTHTHTPHLSQFLLMDTWIVSPVAIVNSALAVVGEIVSLMTSLEAVGQEQSGLKAICLEMNLPGRTAHLHESTSVMSVLGGSLLVWRGSRVHWKERKKARRLSSTAGGEEGLRRWEEACRTRTCKRSTMARSLAYPKSQVKPLNGVKMPEVW